MKQEPNSCSICGIPSTIEGCSLNTVTIDKLPWEDKAKKQLLVALVCGFHCTKTFLKLTQYLGRRNIGEATNIGSNDLKGYSLKIFNKFSIPELLDINPDFQFEKAYSRKGDVS